MFRISHTFGYMSDNTVPPNRIFYRGFDCSATSSILLPTIIKSYDVITCHSFVSGMILYGVNCEVAKLYTVLSNY